MTYIYLTMPVSRSNIYFRSLYFNLFSEVDF